MHRRVSFRPNSRLMRLFVAIAINLGAVAGAQSVRIPTYTYQASLKPNGPFAAALTSDNLITGKAKCLFFPTLRCLYGDDQQILAFFSQDKPFSFINQVKSIYNGASSSATVSADIGTLTFGSGWQLTVGTNIQAGPSGATAVNRGSLPTLSSAAAAQATQNLLYGGTISASAVLPVLFYGPEANKGGGLGVSLDLVGKEGVDIQNFKSGSNTTVAAPPSHGSATMQGYLQYNSINLATNSDNQYAGAVFLGGSYGYNYMSHGYERDYGFSDVSNGIGQLSAGILLNGVAKITVSRAFGPSQIYIDSTSKMHTSVNNFRAWSFGITYQSPPPSKSK